MQGSFIGVKSLQTAMVKKFANNKWEGKTQVDGSARRIIKFPANTELNTTFAKG